MRGILRHPQNPTKKGRFGINTEPPFSCSNQHAEEVCKCAQLHRAKGSRDEVPCGVQRQRLWRGLGAAPLGHPQSTRGRSMRAHSTQSRNGCREGRRPFAGAGQRPCGVQRQRLWWGEGQSPSVLPLPQNLLNRRFFLVCQRHMLLDRFHVLENLRGAACAGNHRRNRRILQNPRKR